MHSVDYNLWKVVDKGPHIPSVVVNGVSIPKLEMDWDENDIKQFEINAKVMNLFYYALDHSEFNRISTCMSTKEIWDTLEVIHEGTDQVKNTKVNMSVHTYEMFRMEPNESITDMYTRFINIVNGMISLGKVMPNADLVNKILRSLPTSWDPMVTTIQEAKEVNKLPLE